MKEKKTSKLAQSIVDSVSNKVSTSVLTKVISDWQSYFFELKRYKSGMKLLKKIGPVVLGIELEKFFSDAYRPRVILINLVDNTSNTLVKVIDQTIKDKKGLDITVLYSQHTREYLDACYLLEQQSRLSLFGNPTLEDIINGIVTDIEKNAGNCFWSCQAVMQLSQLIENNQKKEMYFEKGLELIRKKVPAQLLDMQTKGSEKWITSIKNLDTEKINTCVKESLQKHKLDDIPEYQG
jgi:hypothetical protein